MTGDRIYPTIMTMRKHGAKADARRALVEGAVAEGKFRARIMRKMDDHFVNGSSASVPVGFMASVKRAEAAVARYRK